MTDGGTPTQTLGGLDSIDGGAGTDTLKVDFGTAKAQLPATATIKNIEVISASTSGNNGVNFDVTGIAGVQQLDIANAGTGASTVKGGQVVNVTGGGAATVTGTGLTNVTLTKVSVDSTDATGTGGTNPASSIAISNTVASGANTGTTLTSVTLDNIKDSATTKVANKVLAALNGDGIAEVTVKNQSVNLAATITNTVSTALKVNVDNAGYDAAGNAVTGVVVNAGAKAEAITVNATGSKSNVTVNATAAKTLALTGSADLKLAGVSGAALTSIDGSAATGGLDLDTLNSGTAKVTTGSGADKFQISATKVTVDAGAGNDTVTLGSTIAVGSSIKLGAGNDVLLSNSGALAAKDATGTAVIDGGDGIDTVAASLINATNATQFVNFERIDASAGSTNLDVDLMTGSTVGGLTLNGGSGTVTIQNLAVGAGLTVGGVATSSTSLNNTGSLTIGVKGAATNTADTFAITFAGTATSSATAAVSATKVGLQGVEAVTVASGGTGFVANSLSLAGNTELKTVTITGDKALALTLPTVTGADVTFGGTTTGKGVSLIDGAAATGKLTVDLSNVVTAATGSDDVILNIATGGLTIKGGSADDIIKAGAFSSTLTGNGGKDSFVATAAVAGSTTVATAKMTTITDFTAGDTITGLTTISNANEIGKITLTSDVQNLDQAFALLGDSSSTGTNKDVQWFNYGSDTYVVFNDATAGLSAADVVVKLTGTIDLSNATVTTGGVLALA